MKIPIHEEFRAWSLIDYLGLIWPDRPRRALDDLFARGRIRSGGKPVGTRRAVGDFTELELEGSLDDVPTIFSTAPEGTSAEKVPIRIIHEDARLVVLDKPSGVAVVPDREKAVESCLGYLIRRETEARGSKAPAEFIRCRIVHRIDRFTSGLVIVAKTSEAERRLAADFEGRRVRKEYIALLRGVVKPARFTVNCPVVPGRKGRMRAEPSPEGKHVGAALTVFDVLERWEGLTLVSARPLTGRTHQIRVHAWAAGHPLAIDPLYGKPPGSGPLMGPGGEPAAGRDPPGIRRLTLHALRYELPIEWSEPRAFYCPPPEDFREAVAALRREKSRLSM